MGSSALRLALFVDPEMQSSMALLEGCLRTAAAREDIAVVAVVDAGRRPPSPLRLPRTLAGSSVRRICNLNTGAEPEDQPVFTTPASLARRWRIPLLVPREHRVNDASFVETLHELGPDVTLALMVAQIFRAPLLAACGVPLNYHNGLLPHYQGVAATGWSIYEGAPRSGFTFHRMSEDVDQGPILLQGAVPIEPSARAAPLERAKTALARLELNRLFDLLVVRGDGSLEQVEAGSSFNRAALQAIRTVHEPEKLSLDELELRLRAFEIIDLTLAGRVWRVTALRRITRKPRNHELAFTTADGVSVEPWRIKHLPASVYRAVEVMRRAG